MSTARKKPKSAWQGAINFPDILPISARVDDIANAIRDNQVLILAGETGSGKTTQLPKICLSLGYGEKGLIAHTQPRRIAARTVATRIAQELGGELGETVGYQVRFNDVSGPDTRIKLMTDGILLAEFQRDRLLRDYEVVIIDEAHERSLNIDFLLGLLKPLCKKRPELKVIITSATIDLNKFAEHFANKQIAAPIIEVSGRTYPVETIYAPLDDDGRNANLADVICTTVADIVRREAAGEFKASGDILVFCAGEREIRDAAQALRQSTLQLAVLPLYSRLSVAEQNKVFQPAQHRKVVLATNVAETSITVPGIAYVIDPGQARISRYSFRSKVQRLPIEPISQASANQRLGRCGRVANGVCIRLYSEQDFISRAEFTAAEILRSNLASVILQMRRLGIKQIEKFAFLDQPDKRLLADGLKLLQQLNALDKNAQLTKTGRQMSDLSVDPRFARILVSANQLGCLRDALIVLSALSIRDPRERPSESRAAADQAHAWLEHPQSEFFSYLNLWQAINDLRDELSNSQFKRVCQKRFWSIARIFEWRELYRQLASQCKTLGWQLQPWQTITLPVEGEAKSKQKKNTFGERYQQLHQALISGLSANIACKDTEGEYQATRNRTVTLFPSTPFKKRKPKWLLCAELLETSQLFLLTCAEIRPDWIVKTVPQLCRYRYSEAHYQARLGAVRAKRTTLFYGLVVRENETVNYAPIDAQESHHLFIQQALVEQQYKRFEQVPALLHNSQLIKEIEQLEIKTRRRNLLIDDQQLWQFYSQRIPQKICNDAAFERWLKAEQNANSIMLDQAQLLVNELDHQQIAQFPDQLEVLGKDIELEYHFEPGSDRDGVTMLIPISVLAPFPAHIGDWLVPGLLREKCIALIKTLPKSVRKHFAPAAQTIDRVLAKIQVKELPLHQVLAQQLQATTGVSVSPEQFDLSKLDAYYKMNYRLIDSDGSVVNESRDLQTLQATFAGVVKASVTAKHAPERRKLEQHNINSWDFGQLERSVDYQHDGMTITAYPMLKRQADNTISLLLSDRPDVADYQTRRALPYLALLVIEQRQGKQSYRYLNKELFRRGQAKPSGAGTLAQQLAEQRHSGRIAALEFDQWRDKVIIAALDEACFAKQHDEQASLVRNSAAFDEALVGVKDWVKLAQEIEVSLTNSLNTRNKILSQLAAFTTPSIAQDRVIEDIKAQLYQMFDADFLSYTSSLELQQYSRYLRAVEQRVEMLKLNKTPPKDQQAVHDMQAQLDQYLYQAEGSTAFLMMTQAPLKEFTQMLYEWRVSVFAQQLRTRFPASEKRLQKLWRTVQKGNK